MFIGKGTIMALSTFLTIIICRQNESIDNPFVPAILILAFAYLVGSVFMSIYSFSSTAILHCFLISEKTGNSANVPSSLSDFLDDNDKNREKKDDEEKKEEPARADNYKDKDGEKKEDGNNME
jgi:hypothetical protein